MKYRKKPVVIDAELFDGTWHSAVKIAQWSEGAVNHENGDGTLSVKTLEGTMVAQKGDWVIRGVKGEFYPCKPDIFEATYELAASADHASPHPQQSET